ncbi:MAG TPA: TIGR03118 family protein [Caulobacteraceae bacterium]|jgi:uncharacterized protein (TIGR03118 family)|nr:TIGR03118 family protein [Caulobacteraceae bacterium]
MMKTYSRLACLAVGASAIALAGCGGGGGGSTAATDPMQTSTPTPAPTPTPTPTPTSSGYSVTNLVSDQAGMALVQDPNLVDAWGIAFAPGQDVWVADNGTNKSTLYDGNGVIQSLVVTIPAGANNPNKLPGANPTGIVFNPTSGFGIGPAGSTTPAAFIFVGEDGTIAGWAQGTAAFTAVDNSATAVYKGVTILTPSGGQSLLLAADFATGKIDVFNSSFQPTTVANGFVDPNLPAGYAPFNVQVLNNMVFVAYAEQAPGQAAPIINEQDGAGLGFVDEFDATGKFIMRFDAPGGNLNAPWGLAIAPSNFGALSGDLLVGNFGDGTISAYNLSTGAFIGKLTNTSGANVVLPGLWGIGFGNGADNQPTTTLFFAAGPSAEAHGLYGRIDLPGTYTPPSSTPTTTTPTGPGY